LFDLIERLRVIGARTAKIHYGARGVVAHHNTDLWALSNPVGEGNRGFAGCAFWPMGYAWLTRHMAEHDAYFPDRTFLKKHAFPAVRDAALFFLDVLREDPDGYLSFYPATSPENGFLWAGKRCRVAYASAMSSAIVREVFENILRWQKSWAFRS
jgi:alpha-L-fucosidase 2